MVRSISIIGLETIDLLRPNDKLSTSIFEALRFERLQLADGDVVVVSQKAISKTDGLLVDISTIRPSRKAKLISKRTRKDPQLIQLILQDSAEILCADRRAIIVRRKNGFICLNAGIDKSNINGPSTYSLLPTNPDESANQLRKELEALTGRKLAVIIGDTYSRPFRVGQVEFAIGVSGMEPLVDYKGLQDLYGFKLKFKFVGFADEIAAAAELVMGQGTERVPVAIVRGLTRLIPTNAPRLSKKIQLGPKKDMFRNVLRA